jgi:polyisoprenoid-binding protein YceI
VEAMRLEQDTRPGGQPASTAAVPVRVRPGRWVVVPARSTATFRARDILRRTVVGTFPVLEGTVTVDDTGCPVSVSAVLDATGVDTGIARRDRDLRSLHFFDVAAFPTITFTASEVRPAGAGWVVEGLLVVRDLPCPVSLDVRPEQEAPVDGVGGPMSSSAAGGDAGPAVGDGIGVDGGFVVVMATATPDRRDAGLRAAPGFVVGHRVEVEVRATLQPPPA